MESVETTQTLTKEEQTGREPDFNPGENPKAPKAQSGKPHDPGSQAEQIVKRWLLERDYTTKLAFVVLRGFSLMDHGTEQLANEVTDRYEAEVMAMAKKPERASSSDEVLMTGIACELQIWCKNN